MSYSDDKDREDMHKINAGISQTWRTTAGLKSRLSQSFEFLDERGGWPNNGQRNISYSYSLAICENERFYPRTYPQILWIRIRPILNDMLGGVITLHFYG
jgi:hypothetical protein